MPTVQATPPKTFKVRIYQQWDSEPGQAPRRPEQKDVIDLPWKRTVDARADAAKAEVLRRYPGSHLNATHGENNTVIVAFRFTRRP